MSATSNGSADVSPGAAFAKLITDARQRHGLTQDRLAQAAGVGRATILRWESGYASRPEATTFKGVCRILGVSQATALHALGYLDEDSTVREPQVAA